MQRGLLTLLLLLVCASLAWAAPAPAAPAPAAANHAAPAPAASASHAAPAAAAHGAAGLGRPAAAGAAHAAPLAGSRASAATGRVGTSVRGQAGTPKAATAGGAAQQRASGGANYMCRAADSTLYDSPVPCPEYGANATDYWAGSGGGADPYGSYGGGRGGDLYIVNFWFVPGTPGRPAANGAGAAGGAAGSAVEQHLLGGVGAPAGAAGSAAPRSAPRKLWLQDPGASGVGMPTTRQQAALPVQTRLSEMPVSYAVVLRDGTALASTQPPKQVAGMIVGRDRTGHLYSVKASEVDRAASRLPESVSKTTGN